MKKAVFTIANLTLFANRAYAYSNTQNPSEDTSFFSSLMKFIGFLVIFGVVIFLAYYTTKLIANKTNTSMKSGNIEIVDFMNLSTTAKLIMVKIDAYIYIIALSGGNVTVIDKLSSESFSLKDRDVHSSEFEKQLKRLMKNPKLSDLKDKFSNNRDRRDDI